MVFCPECGARIMKPASEQDDTAAPVKEQTVPEAEAPQSGEKAAGQEQAPEA